MFQAITRKARNLRFVASIRAARLRDASRRDLSAALADMASALAPAETVAVQARANPAEVRRVTRSARRIRFDRVASVATARGMF